ncbi:hypothetical protein PAENIP36_66170 [Paenibacillus sp. P36]
MFVGEAKRSYLKTCPDLCFIPIRGQVFKKRSETNTEDRNGQQFELGFNSFTRNLLGGDHGAQNLHL